MSFHQNLGKNFQISKFFRKIFRISKFFKFSKNFFKFQGQLTLMSFHQNLGLRKIFEFQNFSNFKIFRISRSTISSTSVLCTSYERVMVTDRISDFKILISKFFKFQNFSNFKRISRSNFQKLCSLYIV